jgi:hypothetical protein
MSTAEPTNHPRTPTSPSAGSLGYLGYLGSFNEKAYLWQADLSPWDERVCRTVNRNLNEAEWDAYFPNEPYRLTCPKL